DPGVDRVQAVALCLCLGSDRPRQSGQQQGRQQHAFLRAQGHAGILGGRGVACAFTVAPLAGHSVAWRDAIMSPIAWMLPGLLVPMCAYWAVAAWRERERRREVERASMDRSQFLADL